MSKSFFFYGIPLTKAYCQLSTADSFLPTAKKYKLELFCNIPQCIIYEKLSRLTGLRIWALI